MFKKHEGEGEGEGRFSATRTPPEGAGAEGRFSAVAGGGMSSVPERTPGERLGGAGERAGRTIERTGERVGAKAAEIRDVTQERLEEAGERTREAMGRAGEYVRQAAREVEVEEFRLRGTVAGHPFRVDMEPDGGEQFLAFEFNLETDTGDNVRISGRKKVDLRGGRTGPPSGAPGTPYEGTGARYESPGSTLETTRGRRLP